MVETAARPSEVKGRIWYLEWLRVFACLAVVLIHCFTTLLDNATVAEVGVLRALAWTEVLVVFCRWAVPVFLMVTGALLLDPSREIGWGKVGRYASRVVAVLLTFGVAYALMEIVFDSRSFEPFMISVAVLNVLQGRGWAHFWYLYDLLGIYLILPLLRSFSSSASRRDLAAMLAVLLVFSLAIPTINAASGLGLKTLAWLGSSVFYVLLGRYLSAYEIPVVPAVVLGAVSVALQAMLAGEGIVARGTYLSWVWSPSCPLTAAWAAAVFAIFKVFADVPMRRGGMASTLASCSFAAYVVHPVFANLLYKALGWGPAMLPPVMFELATYLAIFLPSLALSLLLKRTPLVGGIL